MRIGIVTFYGEPNYGAMLQAYALQCKLQQQGHTVYFLPFPVCKKHNPSLPLYSRSIRGYLTKWQSYFDAKNIRNPFLPRLNEMPCNDFQNLMAGGDILDACIVGSDQMWNPAWCISHMDTVFLQFGNEKIRRIAFSPSFSTPIWPSQEAEKLKECLKKFTAIGVREQSGAAIVRQAGLDAQWTIDPTMLWDRSFYDALMTPVAPPPRGQYIFGFFLKWTTPGKEKWLQHVMSATGIRHLTGPYRYPRLNIRNSVVEWLAKIRNASFVVTNSFHGTVFALLYHKPFITLLLDGQEFENNMNERVISLLERLGLQSRLIGKDSDCPDLHAVIDWDDVDKKIAQWRNESEKFLLNALSGDK